MRTIKQENGSEVRVLDFERTADYSKNSARVGDKPHCARCGRIVRKAGVFSIHEVDGGGSALHPEDESKYISDGGDMYHFNVGPECAKIFGEFVKRSGK